MTLADVITPGERDFGFTLRNPGKAPKPATAMTWPEMLQAFREKRREQRQSRDHDWEKLLDGARDVLYDARKPLATTELRRQLGGNNAPDLRSINQHLANDERFTRNARGRWRLVTQEQDEEPEDTAPRTRWPLTMVHPEQDEQRMAKWRRELGPDKKPYRDDQ